MMNSKRKSSAKAKKASQGLPKAFKAEVKELIDKASQKSEKGLSLLKKQLERLKANPSKKSSNKGKRLKSAKGKAKNNTA